MKKNTEKKDFKTSQTPVDDNVPVSSFSFEERQEFEKEEE